MGSTMVCSALDAGAEGSLTQNLSMEQGALVARVFRRRSFDTGSSVFKNGDYPDFVYIVRAGTASVFKDADPGQISTLLVVGPGDSLGFDSLFAETYERSVKVIENLTVVYSPRDTILNLMETIPRFAINVSRLLVRSLSQLEERIVSFSRGSLRPSLIIHLIKLAENGERVEEGVKISNVTHVLLASLVGSSREAVTIALKQLKKDGAIQQQGKGTLIVNVGILTKLSSKE